MVSGLSPVAAEAPAAFGDLVQPFQIENFGLRGRLVRVGPVLERVLMDHGYPDAVAALLGESVALAAVLASGLKYQGVFTLQTQGDGPVPYLVADVTNDGDVRGYARFDAAGVARAVAAGGGPVPRLLGAGHIAFTVDQGPDTERYQGITELAGATLTDCAYNYFRRSEQLETAIVLAADTAQAARAAALMIQRLPPPPGAAAEVLDAEWHRAVVLMSGVTRAELLDGAIRPRDLLYRLFHSEGVRAFRERRLRHACRCSRRKVARTLGSFPRPEVESMTIDGKVIVTCEFCKAVYEFGPDDIAALYPS